LNSALDHPFHQSKLPGFDVAKERQRKPLRTEGIEQMCESAAPRLPDGGVSAGQWNVAQESLPPESGEIAREKFAAPDFAVRAVAEAGLSESAFHMALRAIALGFESCAAGIMAGSARGLIGLGRLVQVRLEIQRSLGVLHEQLWMASSAVAFFTCHVGGVIEGDVPILGHKCEFCGRSFLRILGENHKRSTQAYGEKTHDESTHNKKGSIFLLYAQHGARRMRDDRIGAGAAASAPDDHQVRVQALGRLAQRRSRAAIQNFNLCDLCLGGNAKFPLHSPDRLFRGLHGPVLRRAFAGGGNHVSHNELGLRLRRHSRRTLKRGPQRTLRSDTFSIAGQLSSARRPSRAPSPHKKRRNTP
jgi:hypothetical protein